MFGFLKNTLDNGIFGGPAPFLTQRGADRAMMDDAFARGLRNYQRGPMPQLERPADMPPPVNLMPSNPRDLPVWQAANRRYGEQVVPPGTQRMSFPGLSPAMGSPVSSWKEVPIASEPGHSVMMRPGKTAMPSGVRPDALAGNYRTNLDQNQEAAFREWVAANNVRFDPMSNDPRNDYDMRGFWFDNVLKGGDMSTMIDPHDGMIHYPDKYKTPFHETFSQESQWARPGMAPVWNDKDQLVNRKGEIVFDPNQRPGLQPMIPQMDAEPMQRRVPQFDYGDGTTGTDITNLNVVADLGGGTKRRRIHRDPRQDILDVFDGNNGQTVPNQQQLLNQPGMENLINAFQQRERPQTMPEFIDMNQLMSGQGAPAPSPMSNNTYFSQPPQPYAPLRDPRVQDMFLQSLAQSIAGGAQGRAGVTGAINKAQRRYDMEGRWAGIGSIMQGLDNFKGKKGKGKGQWDEFVKARQAGANNNVLNQINMANQNNAVNQKQMFDMLYSLDPENAKYMNAQASMMRAQSGQAMVPIQWERVNNQGRQIDNTRDYQQGKLRQGDELLNIRRDAQALKQRQVEEYINHLQRGDDIAAQRALDGIRRTDGYLQNIDNMDQYRQGMLGQGQQRIDNQQDYRGQILDQNQQRIDNTQGFRNDILGIQRGNLMQRQYGQDMKDFFKSQDPLKIKGTMGNEKVQPKYPGAQMQQPQRPDMSPFLGNGGQSRVMVPQAALDFYSKAKGPEKEKLRQAFIEKYQVTPEQAAYYGKRR